MSDLHEIYQQVVLDHNKAPRNFRRIEDFNHHAEGNNPLCGDQIAVYLKIKDEIVEDISFVGQGCAICTASASMMTESLKGKNSHEAKKLFHCFHCLLTMDNEYCQKNKMYDTLGKLKVFEGVKTFPVRVKCATLPWRTFQAALNQYEKPVSTE